MKTFKQFMEDGMGGGAMSAGPTTVTGPAVYGTSGGGEPGVKPKKKKGTVLITMARRKFGVK